MPKIGTRANKWFTQQQRQSVSHNVATLSVISRSNHSESTSKTKVTENAEGEKLFVVGETEVGGEEVVG